MRAEPVPFAAEPLTSEEERSWVHARAALLNRAPFWAFLLFERMKVIPTRQIETMGTDGTRLYWNPDYFKTLKPLEQVAAVAHEIDHALSMHCQRGMRYQKSGFVGDLPFDAEAFNKAVDAVTNARLKKAEVGELKDSWHVDPEATGEEMPESLYPKYYKKAKKDQDPGGPNPGGGGGRGGGGQDEHLSPPDVNEDGSPNDETPEQEERAWKEAVAAAGEVAKNMGKLPAFMKRIIDDILEPQVPWQDKLRPMIARIVGSGSRSWSRTNRHRILFGQIAPGRSGFQCGLVAIGVDTSGSIGPKDLKAYLGEINAIVEDCQPERVKIIWCDARVHDVDEVDPINGGFDDVVVRVKRDGAGGGGGTRFEPVFQRLEKDGDTPEIAVYLTDTYGSFPPEPPPYPVIWVCTCPEERARRVPFGEYVCINV